MILQATIRKVSGFFALQQVWIGDTLLDQLGLVTTVLESLGVNK